MADKHDRVVAMTGKNKTQRIGAARRKVLQRFAVGKADQMRRGKPGGEQRRIVCLRLLESLELPGAVVDVVEIIANIGRDTAGFGDSGAGRDAAAQRARVDFGRPPGAGDALGKSGGLVAPAFGELEAARARGSVRV